MRTIENLESERDAAGRQAASPPKSFAEGVAHYVVRRREKLIGQMGEVESTFEVERLAAKIKALSALTGAVDSEMPTKKWKRLPTVVRAGKTGGDNALHLARVMTPEGWEDSVLPKFGAVADKAVEGMIDKEDVEGNLAILTETKRFISRLYNIEAEAKRVLSKRERNVALQRIVNG